MERRQLADCLKAYGLTVDQSTGSGDHKVVEIATGNVAYSKLPFRKKEFAAGTWSGIRRGAKRLGIDLPTFPIAARTNWSKRVKDPEEEQKDAEEIPESKTQWVPMEQIAGETDLKEEWLTEMLPTILPEDAFWDDHVNYDAVEAWWTEANLVPLNKTVQKLGGTSSNALSWRMRGLIEVIPGGPGNKIIYYARKEDIKQLLSGPRKRKGAKLLMPPTGTRPQLPSGFTGKPREKGSSIRNIQPSQAEKWLLENNDFVGQRKLDQAHLNMLCRKIDQDLLHTGQIAFCEWPNKERHLVDGQHFLNALAAKKHLGRATVLVYSVNNDEEAMLAYMQFNDRRSVKGLNDYVHGVGTIFKSPCAPKNRKKIAQAIMHYKKTLKAEEGDYKGHKWETIYDDERAAIHADKANRPIIKFLDGLLSQATNRSVLKMPVMVSIVWHWHINRQVASDFWMPIVTGIGGYTKHKGDEMDPRKTLGDWLAEVKTTQHAPANVPTASETEIFATVQKYWNLWRKGKTCRRFRKPSDLKIVAI